MRKFLLFLLAVFTFYSCPLAEEVKLPATAQPALQAGAHAADLTADASNQPAEEEPAYTVEITRVTTKTPYALHLNFKEVPENTEDAKKAVLEELKKLSEDKTYNAANIIASAWHNNAGGKPEKINFTDAYGAYVWVPKEKKILTFPEYFKYLKKEKEKKDKKEKEKVKTKPAVS